VQWRRQFRWQPRRASWRVAVLFMVGSALFALGSFPPFGQVVDPRAVGITFVVGSVFFTAAAVSQLRLTQRESDDRRLLWAAGVQLVGTILFNVNTVDAMIESFDTERIDRLVWAPDMFGSAAFLIASHLAWLSACGGRWIRREDSDWWIASLNYVGSIFFMLSAIASFTLTTTGEELNTTIVNTGTFLGAVCFFVGAYLLLPASVSSPPSPRGRGPGPRPRQ
jgi:hypothetical protein